MLADHIFYDSADNFEFSFQDVALKLNPSKYSGEYNSHYGISSMYENKSYSFVTPLSILTTKSQKLKWFQMAHRKKFKHDKILKRGLDSNNVMPLQKAEVKNFLGKAMRK